VICAGSGRSIGRYQSGGTATRLHWGGEAAGKIGARWLTARRGAEVLRGI
jgi:hypothetical protein